MQPPDHSGRRPFPTTDTLSGAPAPRSKGPPVTRKRLKGKAGPQRARPGGRRSPASRPDTGPSALAADTPTPPGRSTPPRPRSSRRPASLARAGPPPARRQGAGPGAAPWVQRFSPRLPLGAGFWTQWGRSRPLLGRKAPSRRPERLRDQPLLEPVKTPPMLFSRVLQGPVLELGKMPSGAVEAPLNLTHH